tara:strand:+ start:1528 stop:2016 length:489 start_codon:yes stop_codon:yes gene_type:complete
MTSKIFFDLKELQKGNFFSFDTAFKSKSGTSYELDEWIGRGGNASVFRCRERASGEERAVKFLLQPGFQSTRRFIREINLLRSIKNEHITSFHGNGRIKTKRGKDSKIVNIPFIVMELADCNLQDFMRETDEPISYEKYAGQFRGLAKALARISHEGIKESG